MDTFVSLRIEASKLTTSPSLVPFLRIAGFTEISDFSLEIFDSPLNQIKHID